MGTASATDYFPQVINAEKFGRAQMVRSAKVKTGGRDCNRSHNLLSGLVSCEVCNGTGCYEHKGSNSFTLYRDKGGNVRRYPRKTYERLRCDKFRRKHGCTNASLFDYKVIEKTVLTNFYLAWSTSRPRMARSKNSARRSPRFAG